MILNLFHVRFFTLLSGSSGCPAKHSVLHDLGVISTDLVVQENTELKVYACTLIIGFVRKLESLDGVWPCGI